MHVDPFVCFRYLVAGGLVDRVSRHSRALIETDFFLDQEHESPLLVSSYDLVARICGHLRRSADQDSVNVHGESGGNNNVEQTSNESHLLSTLSASEASGAIGALYAAVAFAPQNQKGGASPTPNHTFTTAVRTLAGRGLKFLRSIAELDLRTLQVGSGSRLATFFRDFLFKGVSSDVIKKTLFFLYFFEIFYTELMRFLHRNFFYIFISYLQGLHKFLWYKK